MNTTKKAPLICGAFIRIFKRVIEPIKFYTEASGLRKVFACEFPIN